MATIYRFIVEQRTRETSSGRKGGDGTSTRASKGAAKKGKTVSLFGGEKGGVEHNRKMRAINPLINKGTYGHYEKGMRALRAARGIVKQDKKGNISISGVSIAILVQMLFLMLLKMQQYDRNRAQKENDQNFKQLENGIGSVHSQYKVSTAFFTGRHTYNQNK